MNFIEESHPVFLNPCVFVVATILITPGVYNTIVKEIISCTEISIFKKSLYQSENPVGT